MHIVLLHDDAPADARADELDVFVQAEAIEGALDALGHSHARVPFTFNLAEVRERLHATKPDIVFNLVEAVAGHGRLLPMAAMLLDALGLPYTGSHTEALFVTTDKVLTKRLLAAGDIATPAWYAPASLAADPGNVAADPRVGRSGPDSFTPGRYIVKSVWEEASVGLDEDSVVDVATAAELDRHIRDRLPRIGGEGFAEQFVDGREFNLSLLAGTASPQVLPPAEIHFVDYTADKPKVVGYRAKWDDQSFEFHHTPRSFDFPPADAPLLATLQQIATRCWHVFGLRGYVRVDFRVDAAGRPWVLEINANPCLAPDAGFYAAMQRGGLAFPQCIERILADA
jgi:D-alanine-D-alanine ligase